MGFMKKNSSTKLKKLNVTDSEENKAVVMAACWCNCNCRDNYNNEHGAAYSPLLQILDR